MVDLVALFTSDDPPDVTTMGGKGAALAKLAQAGFRVPPFLIVPPSSLGAEGLGDALREGAREIGATWWAVRSSAVAEDGAEHSFAGQLETRLGIPSDRLVEAVEEVGRSAFAERVRAYRAERGLGEPEPPAVVVQALLDPRAAGVAFSADPVTGDRGVRVVAAVQGLGSALVDGRETGETVRLGATGQVLSREEGEQSEADRLDPETGGIRVGASSSGPVLSDEEAAQVARLAARCAEVFGAPQDIEWAIDEEGLWLLQSRPITTIPTGRLRVWDNSNIAESYGGVTTPLTFSFARRAYASVYRSFCELLGVPERRLVDEEEVFGEMLGLIRGRVYYNLASWYRVLAMLPGYRLNAPFMEGMMGVREGIPDEIRPEPPGGSKLGDALSLLGAALGLLRAALGLGRMRRRFLARLDRALASRDLAAMDLDDLSAHYRDLEAALLKRWDAPIVNDFLAMIAFGVASKLAESWLPPGLFGHLLSGDGEIISAEPARRIRLMGAGISDETAAALVSDDPARRQEALAADPGLAHAVEDYLVRFGDRCLDELKLESPTLADDPTPLVHAIAAARTLHTDHDPSALRADAERQMAEALRGHPVRRLVFSRVLGLARRRVRDRENLRFERTRVFGRARRIVLAMGERLAAAGRLADPRDVFYLEVGELLGAVDGTGTTHDLAALASSRRAEFGRYEEGEPPPDRFSTRGAVTTSPLIPALSTHEEATQDENTRQGLGCCAGVVEGPVRVVRDPRGVTLEPGTLLVAERTDPGWVLLFPMCAGLIVERGSLLSHSAIVAREMGIPAAVSVVGATAWLRDGDRVRLDGATGTVTRVDA